jgi:hypothetical protein
MRTCSDGPDTLTCTRWTARALALGQTPGRSNTKRLLQAALTVIAHILASMQALAKQSPTASRGPCSTSAPRAVHVPSLGSARSSRAPFTASAQPPASQRAVSK